AYSVRPSREFLGCRAWPSKVGRLLKTERTRPVVRVPLCGGVGGIGCATGGVRTRPAAIPEGEINTKEAFASLAFFVADPLIQHPLARLIATKKTSRYKQEASFVLWSRRDSNPRPEMVQYTLSTCLAALSLSGKGR